MKLNAVLAAAAATVALTALAAGCDRPTDQPRTSRAPTSGQDRAAPGAPPVGPLADRSAGGADTSGSAAQVNDAGITAKVKTALLRSSDVEGSAINVDTEQGHVTLKGKVSDEAQIDRAIQIARNVEGVKEVESQLSASKAG
jgi:hyperosmotically inducible protein